MNKFVKTSMVAALALTMMTFGTMQARAGGWAVAGGVLGGVAVGTAVGVTVASTVSHPYYAYPAPVYAAPAYYAPAPAPAVVAVAPAPVVYGPRVVCPVPYPVVRVGFGWGPRFFGGRYVYHYRR